VTGRGDELSVLFALVSLASLLWVFRTGITKGYILVFVFWALSALTREVSLSYILYAYLIYLFSFSGKDKEDINRFSLWWILIGILPLALIWPILPRLGSILALHVFYIASLGLCLWLAQFRVKWVLLFVFFTVVSFYQGQFWTTEKVLLRHTRSLEYPTHTVIREQLLMKYDDNIPAINGMVVRSHDPIIKAMWMRRLGVVYFSHGDLSGAQQYFIQALSVNPNDVDTLIALAVVFHQKGQEGQSLKFLNRALEINPLYPDTLRTLGIHYYISKDFSQARLYLSRCLFLDPDNLQARELLGLANKMI